MSKQDAAFEAWRRSDDYPRWNDFKVFHVESGETLGVVNTRDAEERERAAFAAGRKAREKEVLADIADIRLNATGLSNPFAAGGVEAAMNLLERRIKETA